MEKLLAPLHPLIVFLDAEPQAALRRAVTQRGASYFDQLLATLNSYIANHRHPLSTLDEMAQYFKVQAAVSLETLQQWSCDLLLVDAISTPLAEVRAMLLKRLALDERLAQPSPALAELERYTGTYVAGEYGAREHGAEANAPMTNPLHVTLAGDTLRVNSYWPDGCALVWQATGDFRLENTSHRISFQTRSNGVVIALTYRHGASTFHFAKGD